MTSAYFGIHTRGYVVKARLGIAKALGIVSATAVDNVRPNIHHMDRRDLIPLDKGKALDREKVAAIAASMAEGGWQGRPLLGVWSEPGPYVRPVRDRRYRIDASEAVHLMTGSHRYAAARRAKLCSIPIHLITAGAHDGWRVTPDGPEDSEGSLVHCSDEEREDALRDIDDAYAIKLMVVEVAGNWATVPGGAS